MKFSNFLFPASMDPSRDDQIIHETLREARLCDELGMEMLWLAEHHFDGICVYVDEEQGVLLKPESAPAARNESRHALLCGSPASVAEAIAEIDEIGVGGLILVFRIGPMPSEVAEGSIRLFMQKVAPEFRDKTA